MKQPHQTLLAGFAMLAATPLHADEWKARACAYLWGSAMEGTTGIGGVTADVDASFGDILDNLEMGFMGMYPRHPRPFLDQRRYDLMGLGATERSRTGWPRPTSTSTSSWSEPTRATR